MGDHARRRWPPRRVLDETTRQALIGDEAAARPPREGPHAAAAVQ